MFHYGHVKVTRSVNSILIMPAYGHVIFVHFLCINELALIGPLFSVALVLGCLALFEGPMGLSSAVDGLVAFAPSLRNVGKLYVGLIVLFLLSFLEGTVYLQS